MYVQTEDKGLIAFCPWPISVFFYLLFLPQVTLIEKNILLSNGVKIFLEAGFPLGRLHMGGDLSPHMGWDKCRGQSVNGGGLMRGDIELMGGT